MKVKRNNRLKVNVLVGLLENLERTRRLRNLKFQAKQVHIFHQTKKFFKEWSNLFTYLNQVKTVDFNKKPMPLKVIHLFKTRIFKRLKMYTTERKKLNAIVQQKAKKANCAFLVEVMNAWKTQTVKSKLLKTRLIMVRDKKIVALRKTYFKGMIRACMIRQRQRAYREYVLMAKGLQGLSQRVDLQRMKRDLVQIGAQNYYKSLQKWVFRSFRMLKQRKIIKIQTYLQATKYLQSRRVENIFFSWRRFVDEKRQRALLSIEVRAYCDKKCIRKIFDALCYNRHHNQHLKQAKEMIETRRKQKLFATVIHKMAQKYSRNYYLKEKMQQIQKRRCQRLEKIYFYAWIMKFNDLSIKEKHITARNTFGQKRKFFSLWIEMYRQASAENFKVLKYLNIVNKNKKQNILREWRNYTQEKKEQKKMQIVSSYFFITKILKRTLNSLKINAIQSKYQSERSGPQNIHLIQTCLEALKDNMMRGRKVKSFQISLVIRKVQSVLWVWYDYVQLKNKRNELVQYYIKKRENNLKSRILETLKVPKEELYADYHMRRILHRWQYQTRRIKLLRLNFEHVRVVREQDIKHRMLANWRQQLLVSFARTKVAIPFSQALLLRKAFDCFVIQRELSQKVRKFQQFNYLSKGFSSFKEHRKRQKTLKLALQQRNFITLKEVFEAMRDQIQKMQSLNQLQQKIENARNKKIRCTFYFFWKELASERTHLQPIQAQIEHEIRQKWLIRLSFQALKRYKQLKSGKRLMYINIGNYRNELILEKVFRELVAYVDHRALKREMKVEAEKLYKRQTLRKMLRVSKYLDYQSTVLGQEQYERTIMRKGFMCLVKYIKLRQGKRFIKEQAELFAVVRKKMTVLKALQTYGQTHYRNRLRFHFRNEVKFAMKNKSEMYLAKVLLPLKFQATLKQNKTCKLLKTIRKIRPLKLTQDAGVKSQKSLQMLEKLKNLIFQNIHSPSKLKTHRLFLKLLAKKNSHHPHHFPQNKSTYRQVPSYKQAQHNLVHRQNQPVVVEQYFTYDTDLIGLESNQTPHESEHHMSISAATSQHRLTRQADKAARHPIRNSIISLEDKLEHDDDHGDGGEYKSLAEGRSYGSYSNHQHNHSQLGYHGRGDTLLMESLGQVLAREQELSENDEHTFELGARQSQESIPQWEDYDAIFPNHKQENQDDNEKDQNRQERMSIQSLEEEEKPTMPSFRWQEPQLNECEQTLSMLNGERIKQSAEDFEEEKQEVGPLQAAVLGLFEKKSQEYRQSLHQINTNHDRNSNRPYASSVNSSVNIYKRKSVDERLMENDLKLYSGKQENFINAEQSIDQEDRLKSLERCQNASWLQKSLRQKLHQSSQSIRNQLELANMKIQKSQTNSFLHASTNYNPNDLSFTSQKLKRSIDRLSNRSNSGSQGRRFSSQNTNNVTFSRLRPPITSIEQSRDNKILSGVRHNLTSLLLPTTQPKQTHQHQLY